MSTAREIPVRVVEAEPVTTTVKRFRLAPLGGVELPVFSAGSHIVLSLHLDGRKLRNPYSLMGPISETDSYQISVLRTEESRGGSVYLHDHVAPGAELAITMPVNLFPLDARGAKHILVAGGIGITPIIAMAEQLARASKNFELHYAMRDEARGAYAGDLKRAYGERVRLYRTTMGERIAVAQLLDRQPLGTHLYVCGPERMIEGVLGDAREAGWPETSLHAERFAAPLGGAPFTVTLERSRLQAEVGEHESILDAVERLGVDAPFLCRGGVCGQCETNVLGCEGRLLHHDHYLSPEEKASGTKIMICVSRLEGRELVLDL